MDENVFRCHDRSMIKESVAYATEGTHRAQLTDVQAAEWLNVSVSTVRRWRLVGGIGPRWVRIGGSVRYPMSDLVRFLDGLPSGGGNAEPARHTSAQRRIA